MSAEVPESTVATLERVPDPNSLGNTSPDETGNTLSPGLTVSLTTKSDIATQQPYVNGRLPGLDHSTPPNGTGNINMQPPDTAEHITPKRPRYLSVALKSLPVNQIVNDPHFIAGLADTESPNWSVLDAELGRAMISLAFRIVRNAQEAEEIKQEALLKCMKNIGSYDSSRARFTTWLLSIVHHLSIDQLRRKRARPLVNEADNPLALQNAASPETLDEVESKIWSAQLIKQLNILISGLPPEQKEVIHEHYFNRKSHQKIADLLGIPLGTVKTRLRLALSKLQSMKAKVESYNTI